MSGQIPTVTPVARSCKVIQWEGFEGYGFNLRPGHYIGKVDDDSPAQAAGLKQGDRIVEVNGVNISNENHKQVVLRIKAVRNETCLLVVDPDADIYFKSNGIIVKSSLPNVVHLQTPPKGEVVASDDTQSQTSAQSGNSLDAEGNNSTEKLPYISATTTPSSERKQNIGFNPEPIHDSVDQMIPTPVAHPAPPASNGNGNGEVLERNNLNANLNLNMTAKELRAKLASRKKYDPKKESMDFKKKFDIVQKL